MKTMNLDQAIEYLRNNYGIERKKRTMYTMIQNNEVPYRKFKKAVLIEPEDLDEWVAKHISARKEA